MRGRGRGGRGRGGRGRPTSPRMLQEVPGEVERPSDAYVDFIQNSIEKCLQQYMSEAEIENSLFHKQKILPSVTKLCFERMENQNPEFFKEYNLRITLKDQMIRLDRLHERQAELVKRRREKQAEEVNRIRQERNVEAMAQMNPNRVVPSMTNARQTHSAMNRPPLVPPAAFGNMQRTINAVPSQYSRGESSRQASMLWMQAHSGKVNPHANIPLPQTSNTWTMNGFNEVTGQMNQNVFGPSPLANGFQTHSMNMYSRFRVFPSVVVGNVQPMMNAPSLIPSLAVGNIQPMINTAPSYFSNGTFLQQQTSLQNKGVMQGPTGMANMHSNMVTQSTNAETLNGYNGVDSQVMFGAVNGVFVPNYNGVQSNSSAFNETEAMVAALNSPAFNEAEAMLAELNSSAFSEAEAMVAELTSSASNDAAAVVAQSNSSALNEADAIVTQNSLAFNEAEDVAAQKGKSTEPLSFSDMFKNYPLSPSLTYDADFFAPQITGEGTSGTQTTTPNYECFGSDQGFYSIWND